MDSLSEFVAGGVAGGVGVVAGQPLDTIRIRQQQAGGSSSGCAIFRQVVTKEGPRSLFRGMLAPLASISFQNAITFQSYATLSRFLNAHTAENPPSYRAIVLAGTGAGAVQSAIISPIELVKIRLQLQAKSNPGAPTGPINVVRTILKTQGYKGLFRGLGVTAIRDAPGHGAYFWTYEYIRELLHPGCRIHGGESFHTMVIAGGMAGATSWLVCYPFDVVKTRLQAQLPDASGVKYSGLWDCLKRSVEREGCSVLWRGIGTTMTRAFVVNAAVFVTYEKTLRCIN